MRRDVPFVHLYFGPQKMFLVDLLPAVRAAYSPMDQIAGTEIVADWTAFKLHWMQTQLGEKPPLGAWRNLARQVPGLRRLALGGRRLAGMFQRFKLQVNK